MWCFNGAVAGINDEGGDHLDGDAKDDGRDDEDDKGDIDFENDDVIKLEFLQFNFVSFSTILMPIYNLLIQLDVNNLCTVTMFRVIGISEPSYNLTLSSIG